MEAFTLDAAKNHVEQLAREINAKVYYTAVDDGGINGPRSYTQTRELYVQPWSKLNTRTLQVAAYWTALHELGHIACQSKGIDAISAMFGLWPSWMVETEAEAWAWALDHSAFRPGKIVKTAMEFALASYVQAVRGSTGSAPLTGPSIRRITQFVGRDTGASFAKLYPKDGNNPHSVARARQAWDYMVDLAA